jgi:hypothetical protein
LVGIQIQVLSHWSLLMSFWLADIQIQVQSHWSVFMYQPIKWH